MNFPVTIASMPGQLNLPSYFASALAPSAFHVHTIWLQRFAIMRAQAGGPTFGQGFCVCEEINQILKFTDGHWHTYVQPIVVLHLLRTAVDLNRGFKGWEVSDVNVYVLIVQRIVVCLTKSVH
jgi:hypothetical protein